MYGLGGRDATASISFFLERVLAFLRKAAVTVRAKPLCAPLPLAPVGVAPVARPLLGRRSKVGLVRTLGGSNGERERGYRGHSKGELIM